MENIFSIDGIPDLGWGASVFLVVALTLLTRFVALRVLLRVGRHFARTENTWDDSLLDAGKPALGWFILMMGLCYAADISNSYVESEIFSSEVIDLIRQLTVVVLSMFFLVRFISLVEKAKLDELKQSPTDDGRLDATTLTALAKLLRMSVVISAVLVALPTLGIEITALLAAGGVGGIAIGFAAQDLLANFFGGLMIYLDRPFAIGDWIRSPDREIEGTVEQIGWRITVVRTFDKRPLYVPNSIFTTLALENPSRMQNRRIYENIGIRYCDSTKMDSIINDVKQMLIDHEEIDTEQTLIVNLNKYGASSLDFFVYTFTKTTNWVRFHEIKQDVMLKIINIVHANDADFAFPTVTLNGIPSMTPGGVAPEH
ncbi:MAG: mechanosensitive ion channel family protein [Gammaproteobacteria bacterium]|nr:mechanosensitive ion channel family protein [Gammaproteobacteria bacterium]